MTDSKPAVIHPYPFVGTFFGPLHWAYTIGLWDDIPEHMTHVDADDIKDEA